MTAAIAIDDLTFRYPRSEKAALDAVSFQVTPGESFALLGPNGSGKTTLFRLLATLLPMQRGKISIFDCDLVSQQAQVRRLLGVVFQHASLDGELTGRENLTHHGRLYGLTGSKLRSAIDAAVQRFDLTSILEKRTGKLSGGQQRRVELAKALLHEPKLLLLDEPTSGLDPLVRRNLWQLLDDLRQQTGLTVLLTTHLLDEADRCDRVAILDGGKRVALDTPAALKAGLGGQVISIQTSPQMTQAVLDELRGQLGELPMHVREGMIHFESDGAGPLVSRLSEQLGPRVQRISLGPPSLDDVFLHLTGRSLENGA
ncbi:MAG: ABC transporter ATP-binding protein [Phycisphaeraceae bacterium]|nr:ABC transporter ATP-binding protein [Phycisphaeraceae bacterium]